MTTINDNTQDTIKDRIKSLSEQRKQIFQQIAELHKQADYIGEKIDNLYSLQAILDEDYHFQTLEF
jgi:uncharacterized coiled-coil DUF342 family protein